MADGAEILEQWIDRCHALAGKDVGDRVAKAAVRGVQEAVQTSARAGTTPTGRAWKPKKAGGAPLVHAADHITTTARGPFIVVTLTGPDVFHHKGLGGKPHRQVIPDGATVPSSVWNAVNAAAAKVFLEIMNGRGA